LVSQAGLIQGLLQGEDFGLGHSLPHVAMTTEAAQSVLVVASQVIAAPRMKCPIIAPNPPKW
jgi:hypothetical protein